jgi:Holliday junction resolvase RusA-like endonuclease
MSAPFMLEVLGDPIPQGSKTVGTTKEGRTYVRDDNKKLKPWRNEIVKAAKIAWALDERSVFGPMDCPLEVHALFYLRRPPSHMGSGRNAARVLPSAPDYPIAARSGDLDKLARAAFDALTQAEVIADDVRIVELTTVKLYADHRHPPGLTLRVTPHATATPQITTIEVQGALL